MMVDKIRPMGKSPAWRCMGTQTLNVTKEIGKMNFTSKFIFETQQPSILAFGTTNSPHSYNKAPIILVLFDIIHCPWYVPGN